eukprot:GHVU01104413.1.p1 GENE.GHVU01104413.1~~GHVU01104413.1.p1  ORF type:complete len:148 (-),score=10.21 GHVU01104413.1:1402-1845(-)
MYGQGNAHGSMPMAMPHIMSYGVVPGASPYGNVGGNEPSSSSFGGGSLSKVDNEAIKSMTAEEAAGVGTVMARGERPEAEKRHLRKAAGQIWNDATLEEWPDNDHRWANLLVVPLDVVYDVRIMTTRLNNSHAIPIVAFLRSRWKSS